MSDGPSSSPAAAVTFGSGSNPPSLYRDSCIKTDSNVYLKDLRIIKNVDMKNIILVDNAVYGFGQ